MAKKPTKPHIGEDQPDQLVTRGRPDTYDPTIASRICELLAQGMSLRSVCRQEGMPPESTVRLWVVDDREGFAAHYTRARDIGMDALADELLEISDTPVVGKKTKVAGDKTETTEGDMIEHRRLQVDARKWYLSKVAPKKYGERLELAGEVQVNHSLADRVKRAKDRLDPEK